MKRSKLRQQKRSVFRKKIEKLEFELEEVKNGTSEHEEQTRILEKEKQCLEKELDRVQVECNHLKEELKVCKSALENAKIPEETTELGQDHMQGELELQRLRELNQKLEEELEESSRTIQQLEIKAKALESLQKELHCFHEENDRLTQEVDIIQTTSKAMTDHELSKASLETEKALLRSEFQTLKDHNRELQAQIEVMSKELKVDQEQCEKFSSIDKRNISLENEVEKLKKIHAHLEQEFTAATGRVKELEATHETLKKENKALKGRIKNLAQTTEEVASKLPSNVSKVNKEDSKKTSASEIKSPAKGTSIRGRKSRKESNEVLQEENENTKENIEDLLRKIEDLRNEKLDLENELCNLRQKFSNNVVVDCNPEDNTVATQTSEIVVNGQFMTQDTTRGRKNSDETFVESEAKHHSAPLLEDISVGFSVMAKERLLLETKASHFARAQMQLEQSLAKALKENATFKNKIKETEDVLTVLREKLHDLENTNATTSEIVDFGMTSSDRESNSVGNEKPFVTSDENVEHPSIEVSSKECQTDLEDTAESKVEEKSCQTGSPQSDINQLTKQKERLLKDLEALQDQKQSLERSLQPQQEDLTKLDEVNVRLEKQEQENVLLKHEKQEDITKLDEVNVRLEKQEQENVLLKHEKQEDTTKLDEVNVRLEKQEQENILLKHEKHSLLAELEAVKHQSDLTDSDLRQKKEYCAKQEEEIKLLLSSYNQEKEALLNELQKSTSENREVKEKLRELQQVQSDFDDIRKKSIEAEKLITELEKDLLSQTEIKNELTRELQKCLNQLKDMDQLEKNLQSSKKESEELSAINGQLKDEIVKRKDENNNLTVELKNTKKKLRSTEKQKNSPLNSTSNLQNLQDRGIQTDSAVDKANDRKLEDKMQQTEQDNIEFHEEGVVINSEQKLSVSNVLRSEFHETDKDEQVVEEPMHQGTSVASQENLQYRDPDVHETSSVGDCNAEKTTSDDGNSNTNIINSGQIVLVNGLENDLNCQLDLCVESFENDSPREQSTPSEEKEQCRSPMGKEIPGDVQLESSDRATQPAAEDNRRLGMCQCQQKEGVPCMGKCLQDENLVTELDLVSGIGPTVFDGAQEEFNLLQIHLNLLHLENDPQKALKDSGIAFETTSLPQQTIDPDTNYGMASLGEGNQEITPSTKRELEWTISNLQSELQKVSEEREKGQQEINLFEEHQLSMKREINRLLSECESLTAKADILQTQNEAVLKEQILNDEENEELQENLQDLFKEKQLAEEAKKELENEKARLEIELSDAVESREAMERELLRMRTEETHHSKHSLEGQLNDIGERYSKLETVLSCVLDENSKMTTELSVLQAENSMLKSFKIMEITDNFTQFSPRTTEDESDGEGRKSAKKRRNGDKIPLAVSLKQDASNTGGEILEKSHRSTYTSSLTGNPNSPLSTVSRPSSPDLQEVGSSRSMGSGQVRADEEGSTAKDISTDEIPGTPTPDANFDDSVFDTDSNRQNMSEVGQPKTTHTTGNPKGTKSARKEPTVNERGTDYLVKSLDKKRLTKSSHRTTDTAEEAQRRESDDNDSSMEAYTSSSLVSVTDLDISISSDQISSEDSSIVGPELRILQKMQKELAETKCSNVLVKNELSIIRKHNSDLQNQVQKLLSRNNHLKQKMCDRTLSVKRMEKEVHSIKDENKRLQEQSLVLKEEMTRVEKEKAKFERNMSSTKSENKRLKTDLSNVKAESYRVMKELVNLQSENRRLQMEIEKAREEAQRIKEAFSLESVSQELSLWGSVSQGDVRTASRRSLQDNPLTTEPSYLHQRTTSNLAFGQHQRPANQTSTPELSPLMLPKVLHEVHTDGSERSIGQRSSAQSEETMSVASTDKIRLADPVSRQGSQLSFTSETSVPDREETGNNSGKTEGGEEEEDGLDTKGKSKKKIKTIFRKLQHSKKGKSSK